MVVKEGTRTIMYSVRTEVGYEGEVVVHKFPYDARDPFGMAKLQKFVKRGFTFNDPRRKGEWIAREVIGSDESPLEELAVPVEEEVGEAPEVTPVEVITEETESLPIVCPDCGKGPFKSFMGLDTHRKWYCSANPNAQRPGKRGKYGKKGKKK